ncbi:hypothetical protein [Hoylesella timonensis]|uniref:hypothetical protein n=1 Tax=Hoylesella timonensis TaxID=386414 RepID=UPI0011AF0B8F|nr:hypothetical protein [Hoylesella timonensis]
MVKNLTFTNVVCTEKLPQAVKGPTECSRLLALTIPKSSKPMAVNYSSVTVIDSTSPQLQAIGCTTCAHSLGYENRRVY